MLLGKVQKRRIDVNVIAFEIRIQLADAPFCCSKFGESVDGWEGAFDLFAAAICQAGIDADLPSCESGLLAVSFPDV